MNQEWNTVANWVNGLIGGFIAAAANTITLLIVDPEKFSPNAVGGWKHLGVAILVSGIVGAALYLKNHPTPFDQSIKVTTTTTETGKPPTTVSIVAESHAEPSVPAPPKP